MQGSAREGWLWIPRNKQEWKTAWGPHPQELKLWIWQLFHYFPYENTEQNHQRSVFFVLFRVHQYLVAVSGVFNHCTSSSVLTLRLPECFKDIRETKDRDVLCFSQLMTLPLFYRDNMARSRLYTNQVTLEKLLKYSSRPENRLLKLLKLTIKDKFSSKCLNKYTTNDSFHTSLFLILH